MREGEGRRYFHDVVLRHYAGAYYLTLRELRTKLNSVISELQKAGRRGDGEARR